MTASAPAPFTWRQCLWLCLPALLVGAILRIWLTAAIPEGFYGADGDSYFDTTRKLWTKGEFLVSHKRRWLYPLFLIPTPLLPPNPVRVIPLVQHLVGLVTIFGLGWIVGSLTRWRAVWVPAVTLLYAVWPRTLWYEHEILVESVFLASFVLLAALALPATALRDRRRLCWFLLAAALVVAFKVHGRGIWLAAMASAVLLGGDPRKWGWKCAGAVAAGLLVIGTSGNSTQGNWLLLNSVLPLVKTEGEPWAEYRAALRPLVEEARADGLGYAWTQENYKKRLSSGDPAAVHPRWAQLTRDKEQFSRVCKTLSREALWAQPVRFAQFTGMKALIALRTESARSTFQPARFWEKQEELNDERWVINAREMQLFYQMDPAPYAALVAERRTRTFGATPFLDWVAKNFGWVEEDFDETTRRFSVWPRWPGVLAALGLGLCLLPGRFAATAVLWLPAGLYFATVFAVADRLPRFVQPVEWVGWVLAAIALDALLTGAGRIFRRKSSSPPPPAAA